ncbi:unnamed protein product [Trichobilharzia szidati]|nr:unnamed protein product [Trichobilharzia szidati]
MLFQPHTDGQIPMEPQHIVAIICIALVPIFSLLLYFVFRRNWKIACIFLGIVKNMLETALQKFFYKNIAVTLGIVVFAAALLVFTFAVKKIQENFWYSHIAYGLIVLLISIAYCCVFHEFFALNIFIILNVALALAAAVVLIAVNLKRLDLTAFTAVVFLAVLIAFIGLLSMLLSVLRVPFSEAVSELCLCFGAMFGLFLLGNTTDAHNKSKQALCVK